MLICKKAFTLIELLVVIAIIAILYAILLPAIVKGKYAASGSVVNNNMRQIVIAATLYAEDNQDRFPATMISDTDELPGTISFWDVQSYQNNLSSYIAGIKGGIDNYGKINSNRKIWFDPLDPDKIYPVMWGSFIDNGFVTGVGVKQSSFRNSGNTIYSTLRHSQWSKVTGITIPNPLPINSVDHPFWMSEFFDMCLDPWSTSSNIENDYHWKHGKAIPPIELFPKVKYATPWSYQIEGRNPSILVKQMGRYGKLGFYSFCDGSVRRLLFETTYQDAENNYWSIY